MPNTEMTSTQLAFEYLWEVVGCGYWLLLPIEPPYGPVFEPCDVADICRDLNTGVEIIHYLRDGKWFRRAHRLSDEHRRRFCWEHGLAMP